MAEFLSDRIGICSKVDGCVGKELYYAHCKFLGLGVACVAIVGPFLAVF
jgi:hypothetical protein